MKIYDILCFGDSKVVVSSFPDSIKEDIGFALYQIQLGRRPLNSRSMSSIGLGVYEIKTQDHQGWYRVVYVSVYKDKIVVLHVFKKQSAKTSKNDLELCKRRFSKIKDLYEK